MKIVFPFISTVFDTETDGVNTIIIEKQALLSELCMDIYGQLQGMDGKTVISANDKPIDISKNVELLIQFIPFEINKKGLLSKLAARVEKIANEPDYYEETVIEMAGLEKYLWSLTENLQGNIYFSKIAIGNIIRSVGMEFDDNYVSLGEKIIDYMELVREYDKDKLFIMVNLRSFIDDDEAEALYDTILRKQFHVIIIENCEHMHIKRELCYIVDKDYCEIQ